MSPFAEVEGGKREDVLILILLEILYEPMSNDAKSEVGDSLNPYFTGNTL